jgi:hypothetical protein
MWLRSNSSVRRETTFGGDKLATVSTLDCGGALGGASTRVHIRNSNMPFSFREGLVLTVDAKVLEAIRWKDNQSLVVYGPKKLSSSAISQMIASRLKSLNWMGFK